MGNFIDDTLYVDGAVNLVNNKKENGREQFIVSSERTYEDFIINLASKLYCNGDFSNISNNVVFAVECIKRASDFYKGLKQANLSSYIPNIIKEGINIQNNEN